MVSEFVKSCNNFQSKIQQYSANIYLRLTQAWKSLAVVHIGDHGSRNVQSLYMTLQISVDCHRTQACKTL